MKAYILIMLLLIPAMVKASINESLSKAYAVMGEFEEMGYGVDVINDTINEAIALANSGHEEAAILMLQRVFRMNESIRRIDKLIDEIETELYELSSVDVDTSEMRKTFLRALKEVELQNYLQAEEMLLNLRNDVEDLKESTEIKEILESRENVLVYIRRNASTILTLLIFFLAPLFITKRIVDRRKERARNEMMKRRIRAIKKLMRKCQEDYFKYGRMGKFEYNMLMNAYREMLIEAESVLKKKQ